MSDIDASQIRDLWENGRTSEAIDAIRDDPHAAGFFDQPIVQELLQLAATDGRCEEIRQLAALGADVNFRSGAGETPLLEACDAGQAEAARVLIELGADPNDEDYLVVWPLFAAARSGSVETLDAIIAAGAPVDHENFEGETAVAYAVRSRELATLERLIALGADITEGQPHDTPLRSCILNAWLPGVRALVEGGAPIDRRAEYTWFNPGAAERLDDERSDFLFRPVVRVIGRFFFVRRLLKDMHTEDELTELELARLLVERPETRQQLHVEDEPTPDAAYEAVLAYLESRAGEKTATPPPAA